MWESEARVKHARRKSEARVKGVSLTQDRGKAVVLSTELRDAVWRCGECHTIVFPCCIGSMHAPGRKDTPHQFEAAVRRVCHWSVQNCYHE